MTPKPEDDEDAHDALGTIITYEYEHDHFPGQLLIIALSVNAKTYAASAAHKNTVEHILTCIDALESVVKTPLEELLAPFSRLDDMTDAIWEPFEHEMLAHLRAHPILGSLGPDMLLGLPLSNADDIENSDVLVERAMRLYLAQPKGPLN